MFTQLLPFFLQTFLSLTFFTVHFMSAPRDASDLKRLTLIKGSAFTTTFPQPVQIGDRGACNINVH